MLFWALCTGRICGKDLWRMEERMRIQRTQRLEAKPVQQGQGDCCSRSKRILGGKARADRRAVVSTQLLMQMAEGSAG